MAYGRGHTTGTKQERTTPSTWSQALWEQRIKEVEAQAQAKQVQQVSK